MIFFKKKPDNFTGRIDEFLARRRLFRHSRFSWLKRLALVLFLAVLAAAAVFGPLAWQGVNILNQVLAAKKSVDALALAASQGDWLKARASEEELRAEIALIAGRLKRVGPVALLPPFKKNLAAVDQMLAASGDLLSGYGRLFLLLDKIDGALRLENMAFGFSQPGQRKEMLRLIQKNSDGLAAVEENINWAKRKIAAVNTNDFYGPWQKQLLAVSSSLTALIGNTEISLPLFSRLPELLGLDREKNYLLVFENNMELRPTGGFIGSYGLVSVQDGNIAKLSVDDVYNLDKLSKDRLKIPAPEPMQKYNNQKYWFMRDANWSPNWPDAAREISGFFQAERANAGLPPVALDGVIALTPDFTANILSIIGPATLSGLVFDAQNFAQDLEKFVEFDYAKKGISLENRKSIIGDLAAFMADKIFHSPPDKLLELWSAFKKNIDEKNILVYLFDQKLQASFVKENWSGEVKAADGDYLMALDSNLAALKTDQVMEKSLNYKLFIDQNGDLIARLTLNYRHTGDYVKNLITDYRDYLRLYAPAGSWFLKAQISDRNGPVQDIFKDLSFSDELGKKVAAIFFTVKPRGEKTLVLEYRLPENVKQAYQGGLYKLLIQKQPGTIGHKLTIDLEFNSPVAAYQADNFPQKFGGQSIGWQTDLKIDRVFKVKF